MSKGFGKIISLLGRGTRLDESCINLVHQEEAEKKEKALQTSQKSLSLSDTNRSNEINQVFKPLSEIPSTLKVQEDVRLDITAFPELTDNISSPTALTANLKQISLTPEIFSIVSEKPLTETTVNTPKAVLVPVEGPINIFLQDSLNLIEAQGIFAIGNQALTVT